MGVSVKRIVVTGMGIVSPLGCGVQHVWQSLLAGKSGITRLSEQLVADIPCKVAGQVPSIDSDPLHGFDPLATIPAKERKKMDRFIEFALVAAREALAQAGWSPASAAEQERTATVIATGIGGFSEIANAVHTTDERGPRRLSPFTIPSFLANLAAGHVSIAHGFRGPIGAPVTACAAGAQAIGDAARMIRSGEADIALCGGAEAAIHRVSLAGFAAARALSSAYSDHPESASRPFDRDRDGFVMGEGAGIVVLEELEHAKARGAHIYAEVVGYGSNGDAYHITAPAPGGVQARKCMELAIKDAGIDPKDVNYINAHGTSTGLNDQNETLAIKELFGDHAKNIAVNSTKSMTGHLLGAAGAIETIVMAMAIETGKVHPTINCDNPDEGLDLDYVREGARELQVKCALSNSFGFGGHNGTLCIRRYEA